MFAVLCAFYMPGPCWNGLTWMEMGGVQYGTLPHGNEAPLTVSSPRARSRVNIGTLQVLTQLIFTETLFGRCLY